jgi:prepilin-type N-terminal cleavage/methylation domain-containing protein
MVNKFSKFSLLRSYFVLRRCRSAGFTLVELLVALLIGSIITFLLLFTVIELLNTNQREAARSDTQRDAQAALDYITRDLREAVYVYDSRCFTGTGLPGANIDQCPGLMQSNVLPASWPGASATNTPVLAFWRIDELPDGLKTLCDTNRAAFGDTLNAAAAAAVSGVACISRRTYTLVVYSIQQNAVNDPIWKGKARLTRYELPQFPKTTTTVTQATGWVSPTRDKGNFFIWPFTSDLTTLPAATAAPTGMATTAAAAPTVLVDFVDDANLTNPQCPSPTTAYIPSNVPAAGNTSNTSDVKRGFYVCVNGASVTNQNQEVAIYLRANAAGRPGIPRTTDVIIPLETRVMARGALQKGGS